MPDLDRRSWRGRLRATTAAPHAPLVAGGILTAAPRIYLALNDHSVFWPDEIYQSIEPAHRVAFGYGLVSWEFRDGARSWLLPGLLSAVMKFAALFTSRSIL